MKAQVIGVGRPAWRPALHDSSFQHASTSLFASGKGSRSKLQEACAPSGLECSRTSSRSVASLHSHGGISFVGLRALLRKGKDVGRFRIRVGDLRDDCCKSSSVGSSTGTGSRDCRVNRGITATACGRRDGEEEPGSSSVWRLPIDRSQVLKIGRARWLVCRAKGSTDGDANDEDLYDENGFDRNGFDKDGRNRFGRDKFGLDEDGFDELGMPGDAVFDRPIVQPEYTSYIDPNTGEPSPTYGFRNALPNAAFWGEDLSQIQKSSPTSAAVERSSSFIDEDEARDGEAEASESDPSPPRRKSRGGGRRKKKGNSSVDLEDSQSEELSEEELANIAQLDSLRDKFRAEEEGGEYKSIAQMIQDSREEDKAKEKVDVVSEDGEEKDEEEDLSLGVLYGQTSVADRGHALLKSEDATDIGTPLTNDELWWNWQKPPPGKKPWSAWQKRAGDCDTVMAAAMAETGQIKLFGEKPTIAEATLARARKRVFYNERMDAEAARKKDIGALAYYKEWVKAYKKDTSKDTVQKHFEETGEEEGIQLLNMFSYQTAEEYRKMMGTDIRIRRDPLTMRMRPDQIKQVWGGDPVYPTINYEQSPDHVFDYRNENMHEPIPDIVEILRESGRLITREELKAMLEKEKLEEEEFAVFDGLAGAMDVGDEDEDDFDEEAEVADFEDNAAIQSMLVNADMQSRKSSAGKKGTFGLDGVIDAGELDGEVIDIRLEADKAIDTGEVDVVIDLDKVVDVREDS